MKSRSLLLVAAWIGLSAFQASSAMAEESSWNQWRGQSREAKVAGTPWPDTLSSDTLQELWRVELPPSYSGPVVSENAVFTTATEDRKQEVAYALDRATGKQLWRAEWKGAMRVPFFAASNGSWIRATPAFNGTTLFVPGIRDVLVALDAKTGAEQWRIDFVERFETSVPSFGFASSPLLDGDALYIQAGASVVKVDAKSGEVLWRALKDGGGMLGSAFSSPTIAVLAGERQLVVQTRAKLAGLRLSDGEVLWEHKVPSFRGMNILTPVTYGDAIFTSSYKNKAWLYAVEKSADGIEVDEAWVNNAQAYMSSPVVIGSHVYLHLQNQRFTCIDLTTGERKWTSQPYGKYCSLVAQGEKILALDQRGKLLLIKANPNEFELLGEQTISDQETWAHLAVSGDELYIRELGGMKAFRWSDSTAE